MQEQSERQQAQSPIFQGIRFIEHRGSAQHIPCAYMDRKLERPFSPPWFAAYLRRQRMGLTGVPWSDHCPGGSDLPPTVAQETEELGEQPNHDADLVHGFLSGVWGLTVVEDTAGDRGAGGNNNNGHPSGWPSSQSTLRLYVARVGIYTAWRYGEATVAPPTT